MPISLTCASCGKRLKANDPLVGRTVPCPACGAKLVIQAAEEDAAAMLLDEAPAVEPSPAPVPTTAAEPRRPTLAAPRPIKQPTPRPEIHAVPLTTKEPPLWLRHLHWLLVLSLIPLALSLLTSQQAGDFVQRLNETIDQLPADSQLRADQAVAELIDGKGSLEKLFAALPEHKLKGAWLPRDTWAHWLFTLGAGVLYLAFLFALTMEGSATPHHLLVVGIFTATIGIVFLLVVQFLAAWSQGVIIIPRSIPGILFCLLQLIGFSYRAAADPENGFVLSLLGYTFGVGLCEEICKALPIIVRYHRPNNESWRGAFLWGLASGAGFGLAEGVMYAGDFYNGISGADIYFVRNISCVALHALWTGSAAITIHQKQHLFQQAMAWYDWLVRALAVVAVPMVLHGLYDTLLKKEMNGLALAVAVASFGYLAFQISRLRGVDDQAAHEEMLREYQRRRKAMGV